MISSYQISQRFDAVFGVATALGALWAFLRTLALLALAGTALACVFAVVVAFWLPIVQFAGCVAGIALFAYVTFPRSAKPARCPYCGSKHISGGRGSWDCDDCGRGGSY